MHTRPGRSSSSRKAARRYGCCQSRTWLVIVRFVVVLYFMFLVQQWTDSVERPNEALCEIKDTFFMIIPDIPRVMGGGVHAADILIAVQLGMFFVWIFAVSPNRELWIRRWFSMWSYGYFLRMLTVGATHFYAPPFKDQLPYQPDSPYLGALYLLASIRASLNDLMFSGHTMTWVLSARFVFYYGSDRLFHTVYIAAATAGPLLLIAVREHYSADVIVGAGVGTAVFSLYHLWYDRFFRRRWDPTWEVYVPVPMIVSYPCTLTMADGTRCVIGEGRVGERELVGNVPPERQSYMNMVRWLDGGDEHPDAGPSHPGVVTMNPI